jgi:hypothetical protein
MHTGEGEGVIKMCNKTRKRWPPKYPPERICPTPPKNPLYYGWYNKLKFDKFKKDLRFYFRQQRGW